MKRISITVTTRNDINYDTDHLSIEKQMVDGKTYIQLSFLCSGSRVTLMAEAIKQITFSIDSAT